jgi:acetylglutamate kinase
MALIVKVGGTVAADEQIMTRLLQELATLGETGVLVHGGGKAVTELAARLGITSEFSQGVRITKAEEMALVDMVLAGRTNTELVRLAQRAGVSAAGLTGADGNLLVGALQFPEDGGRTARVKTVHLAAVHALDKGGFLPVIATVGTGEDGYAVNINADEAAQAIARQWVRDRRDPVRLCFISDTAGVLDAERRTIPVITLEEVEALVTAGTIRDGMAAKIRSCAEAVRAGVDRIVIGTYRDAGDLQRLLQQKTGTIVTRDTPEPEPKPGREGEIR